MFVNMCASISMSLLCFFFDSFTSFIILSYSNLFVFKIYLMLLLFLRYHLFSKERQKGLDLDWKADGEELGKKEGEETLIRMYCRKK